MKILLNTDEKLPAPVRLRWGPHNSNFTMLYGRYIELHTMAYKPTFTSRHHNLVELESHASTDQIASFPEDPCMEYLPTLTPKVI